jgi:GMP synthase (glutamine-hydrolysing)
MQTPAHEKPPDRRLRQSGDPADRPAAARGGVYCEIHPFDKAEAALEAMTPQGDHPVRRPESVHEEGSPRAPRRVRGGRAGAGHLLRRDDHVRQLGGKVEGGHTREFGRAEITVEKTSAPAGRPGLRSAPEETVWMSHGDKITAIPQGFDVVASSAGSPYAVIADETRRFYGVQFHPEVMHTPRGHQMLKNFTHGIAGLKGDWTMAAYPRREGRPDPRTGRARPR